MIVGGKLLGGSVSVNDSLTLLPAGITVKATSVHAADNTSVSSASAGEVVEHIETEMILCKDNLRGIATRS